MARPLPLSDTNPLAYRTMQTLAQQAEQSALDAGLDPLTIELVRIRVSQLNGCAFCLRFHTRDALAKGETADRIAVLPAWRETEYFTEAEAAALAIAEYITDIANTKAVADGVDAALTAEQHAAVRWIAIAMNALNRIAISSHYAVRP